MIKQWTARLAVTLSVGLALIAGVTSPAHAADTSVDLIASGAVRATMTHIDDGDDFEVWDRSADTYGVRGTLQKWHSSGSGWVDVESVYNGLGSGRKVTFEYDVSELGSYRMKVCNVNGAGDTTPVKCASKEFSE
jgi:hypothetical protein